MMVQAAVTSGLVSDLASIVGPEFVTTSRADLYIYAQDLTQAKPHWPDVVVLPKTVADVQAILRLADREKVPVTPYVAGGNIGGVAIPLRGGIILDLKRMDRIIEVNDTDMYALVEPGVTFGHIKRHLDQNHPDLVYTYAFSPPATGVVTNALLQGLDNLSFRYGAASHWVSGVEAVLANGEVVRIGSGAISDRWAAIAPMPELAGLFLGWQGTTGVITKMAVSLWPKPKHVAGLHFRVMDHKAAFELLRAVSRTRVPDDVIGTSFALSKASAAAMRHEKVHLYPAPVRQPGDPEFTVSVEVSGNTEDELRAKMKVVRAVVRDDLKEYEIKVPRPSPAAYAGFPMQALPVLSGGGGLTWVGTYGPMSRWLETVERGCQLQDKWGIARTAYTRVMNEGHFIGLRWMLPYDKGDPDLVRRIEGLCADQLELVLETGFVPYKTPYWAVRKIEQRAGPEWVRLHQKIKKLLDPNNILNPGRWGAPAELTHGRR